MNLHCFMALLLTSVNPWVPSNLLLTRKFGDGKFRGFIVLLLLLANSNCVSGKVLVNRSDRDTKYGAGVCVDSRARGRSSCVCSEDFNTAMSWYDEPMLCRRPSELGCYYSLLETRQTFLVTEGNTTRRIIPELTDSDLSIYRIFVWNLQRNKRNVGIWHGVTREARQYFLLNNDGFSDEHYISTSNLNMKLWAGHVIKIMFKNKRYKPCLTMKVIGKINYPFDIDTFKSGFWKRTTTTTTTTTSPPTTRTTTTTSTTTTSTTKTTTAATTETTTATTKTTTAGTFPTTTLETRTFPTTTSKTKTFSATTLSNTKLKTIPFTNTHQIRTFIPKITKISTTARRIINPFKAGRNFTSLGVNGNTTDNSSLSIAYVYIITALLIGILLVVLVFFIPRRISNYEKVRVEILEPQNAELESENIYNDIYVIYETIPALEKPQPLPALDRNITKTNVLDTNAKRVSEANVLDENVLDGNVLDPSEYLRPVDAIGSQSGCRSGRRDALASRHAYKPTCADRSSGHYTEIPMNVYTSSEQVTPKTQPASNTFNKLPKDLPPLIEPPCDALPDAEHVYNLLPRIKHLSGVLPDIEPTNDVLPDIEPTNDVFPDIEPTDNALPQMENRYSTLPSTEPANDVVLPDIEHTDDVLPQIEHRYSTLPSNEPATDVVLPDIKPADDVLPQIEHTYNTLPSTEPARSSDNTLANNVSPDTEPVYDDVPNIDTVDDTVPHIEHTYNTLPRIETAKDVSSDIEIAGDVLPTTGPVASRIKTVDDDVAHIEPVDDVVARIETADDVLPDTEIATYVPPGTTRANGVLPPGTKRANGVLPVTGSSTDVLPDNTQSELSTTNHVASNHVYDTIPTLRRNGTHDETIGNDRTQSLYENAT